MPLIEYILLFLTVFAGGGLAFFLHRRLPSWALPMVLAFSGAYLLGITAVQLMPGVFVELGVQAGIWLLVGFFIQLFLETLSQGIEHGHVHAHERAGVGFALQIMVGLCLHAYLEGAPLGGYAHFYEQHHHEDSPANHLLYGIILHKMPAAFALVALMLRSGYATRVVLLCLLVFASMSPLGAWTGEYLAPSPTLLSGLIALVIGSFLHIATTILFETEDQRTHRLSWWKLPVIAAGVALALATL